MSQLPQTNPHDALLFAQRAVQKIGRLVLGSLLITPATVDELRQFLNTIVEKKIQQVVLFFRRYPNFY